MNIQGNLNQTLSLATFLFSQTPTAENIKTAKQYKKKEAQAIRGLEDIEGNVDRSFISEKLRTRKADPEQAKYFTEEALRDYVKPQNEEEEKALQTFIEKGPKNYNKQELEDIEARTRQYQGDIYDSKSAELNPAYKRHMTGKSINQPKLSKTLSNIRAKTAAAKEALAAKNEERQASNTFVKTVMEGVYSPLTDPRKSTGGMNGK